MNQVCRFDHETSVAVGIGCVWLYGGHEVNGRGSILLPDDAVESVVHLREGAVHVFTHRAVYLLSYGDGPYPQIQKVADR